MNLDEILLMGNLEEIRIIEIALKSLPDGSINIGSVSAIPVRDKYVLFSEAGEDLRIMIYGYGDSRIIGVDIPDLSTNITVKFNDPHNPGKTTSSNIVFFDYKKSRYEIELQERPAFSFRQLKQFKKNL